jgi:hypothetical protein
MAGYYNGQEVLYYSPLHADGKVRKANTKVILLQGPLAFHALFQNVIARKTGVQYPISFH